jgi:hypothetical protein
MPAVEAFCFALNPLLCLLMGGTVLAVLFRRTGFGDQPGLLAVVVLVGFETLVYSLLQSEPRYSIPFRPLEMVLAATALQGLLRLRRSPPPADNRAGAEPAGPPPQAPTEDAVPRGVI